MDISTLNPLIMGKNDDFVPQSIIFSLSQWKYHFLTQQFVEMPHFIETKFTGVEWATTHYFCFVICHF